MIKKIILLKFMLLLALNCSSNKYELGYHINQTPQADSLKFKIDSIVNQKIIQYQIPGLALGVVSSDSILYTNGYGVKDIKNQELVTANSIFHAGSISKLFTAHAIVNLIDEGKLNLDDKVADLVPDINSDDIRFNQVSVKDLLNHTSGLPDIRNYKWRKNNQSANTLEKYILTQNFKLKSAPTQTYRYSNLAYNLLGYIVEYISKTPFEDYIKSTIFKGLEMKNSDFRFFMINDSLKTSPHSKKRISGKIYPRKHYPYTREHGPSSTLNTSSEELCNWMNFILKDLNENADKSKFYKMTLPSLESNKYIGLGFQLFEINGNKAIGHFGGDKGFRSYLIMIPNKQLGLCLLANCDYNENFREEILHPILEVILD